MNYEERVRKILDDQIEKLAEYVNKGSSLVEMQMGEVTGMLTMSLFLDVITQEEYQRLNAACRALVFDNQRKPIGEYIEANKKG